MRATTGPAVTAVLLLAASAKGFGEDVLFEGDFENGLSPKWEVVGLKKSDFRVKDGGLEVLVRPGKLTNNTPMLKVTLPFTDDDSLAASFTLTVLDEFTREGEFAGVFLTGDGGREFRASQELVGGKRVYAPGKYRFAGKPGEEGDSKKYEAAYTPATKEAGPMRILVHSGAAYFQVGPSPEGKYLNFFHNTVGKGSKSMGFCLTAAGAPDGASHWVRFENFRVVER